MLAYVLGQYPVKGGSAMPKKAVFTMKLEPELRAEFILDKRNT